MITLHNGNCLEVMKSIPDRSVDFILTDPPYGTIKNAPSTWDKNKTYWDNVIDNNEMFSQCERILRFNGCMALFCQDPYTANLMLSSKDNLRFSYRYTWDKKSFGNHLGCKKFPVNFTEDICVFFNNIENKENHPLSEYFLSELKKSNKTVKQICIEMKNTGASHYFTNSKQFRIPTEKQYLQLQQITNCFDYKYEKIVNDFNLYANLRTFNLMDNCKYKSNILEYKKDNDNFHPTQKPVLLLEDLIKTYTNENDMVLDFTMGSGSTGVACKRLNRNFIGIELDRNYFDIATKRINEVLL
jgi:site-specific DNA-methyltransferase (adenine-specific)